MQLKFPVHAMSKQILTNRGVIHRGAGSAMHDQILADQLTLSQPEGADYAHQIIPSPQDSGSTPADIYSKKDIRYKYKYFGISSVY